MAKSKKTVGTWPPGGSHPGQLRDGESVGAVCNAAAAVAEAEGAPRSPLFGTSSKPLCAGEVVEARGGAGPAVAAAVRGERRRRSAARACSSSMAMPKPCGSNMSDGGLRGGGGDAVPADLPRSDISGEAGTAPAAAAATRAAAGTTPGSFGPM